MKFFRATIEFKNQCLDVLQSEEGFPGLEQFYDLLESGKPFNVSLKKCSVIRLRVGAETGYKNLIVKLAVEEEPVIEELEP